MRHPLLLIFILLLLSLSCTKNNDDFVTGRVEVKGGCFPDSWLVSVNNPDPKKYSFLSEAGIVSATAFNSSNAVFINLPSSFAATGTRIRFKYIEMQVSCFSSTMAPNHIKVKDLSRF